MLTSVVQADMLDQMYMHRIVGCCIAAELRPPSSLLAWGKKD